MKSPLGFWDRVSLSLAPDWALRRIRARTVASLLGRNYEAAQPGRRTSGWNRNNGDANTANAGAVRELRLHARDLIRNNAWARKAQRIIANNTVGWGIVPKAQGPNAKNNAKAQAVWKRWAESTDCETEGRFSFYGLQQLLMRCIPESGEILVRRRLRFPEDGLFLPIQLQVLESDFLDSNKDGTGIAGGPIVQGIEYDKLGRRAAYWLFPEHPGSTNSMGILESKRVPASEILHVFHTQRPGEARGVSWFGAAIVTLKELDAYDDAELMKQRIAACFSAFVSDSTGAGTAIGEQDPDDAAIETLEPGMIHQLPDGKTVTFANPPGVTSDSLPTRNLRKIAAALGVTYEDLTGDYSQVNFSSARMGRIAHQGNVRDWQANMLIPLFCAGVWRWVMEVAVAAGEISEVPGSEWTSPPLPMLEPDKEGLAYQRLVRIGLMTPSEMVREQGGDPEAHWEAYAADLKKLDALEIKLDSDVRAVSQSGQEQAGPSAQSQFPQDAAPPPADQKNSAEDFEINVSLEEIT